METPGAVLLIGQAPGRDGDLRPLTGRMGRQLADLAGIEETEGVPSDERLGRYFDRANIFDYYPGRDEGAKGDAFPIGEARLEALRMLPAVRYYPLVVFCGRAVSRAFGVGGGVEYLTWQRRAPLQGFCAVMPHTSGIVPWWNAAAHRDAATIFMSTLRAMLAAAL